MVLQPDEQNGSRNIGYSIKKLRTFLVPFREEEHHRGTVEYALTEKETQQNISIPRLVLPSKSIDQLPPSANLKALYAPLALPLFALDDYSIDQATTERIPAFKDETHVTKTDYEEKEEESHVTYFNKLIKSSGIYALSSLASPMVSLVLAPFLTRNLTHAEYGALAVLNTAISLFAGVTQLGLNSAFFRSYNYDYESQRDRKGVLSTIVILLLSTSLISAITMTISAPWLSMLLFNSSSLSNAVKFTGIVILVQNLTVPGFAWMRAENRAIFFSLLSIANLLVTLIDNIFLVGFLHFGITGSLLATGSGYALVVICTLPVILLHSGIRLRFDIARGLLSFGLPNVSTFVSVWILQLSDRFLLARLGSLAQTASYAVAYSLGGVVSVVVLSPFTLAWPSAMYSIAKKDDAGKIFRIVFQWFGIVLLFAAFSLSILSTFMLNLLFPVAYHSAAPIIPVIAMSMVFFGIYNMFTTGISIRRKTWFAFLFTTISALSNVGFNLILIPLFGSMGAALSTLLAYLLLAIIAYIVNQRIYPIPFGISTFIVELLLGTGFFMAVSYLIRGQEIFRAAGISLIVLALYGGCLAILGKWHPWSYIHTSS